MHVFKYCKSVKDEMSHTLDLMPLWTALALTDIKNIYRRSYFGFFWIGFSFALFVGVKLFIFGGLISTDENYGLWVLSGFWLFYFCQISITNGINCFSASKAWILGANLPKFGFVIRSYLRVLIHFAVQSLVFLIYMQFLEPANTINYKWVILGLVFLLLSGVWVQLLLGMICLRFRDVGYFIMSLMNIMFFLTPILFFPWQMGDKAWLFDLNPITHYVALVRDPLLYGAPDLFAWKICGITTFIGMILTLFWLRFFYKKIPFWV